MSSGKKRVVVFGVVENRLWLETARVKKRMTNVDPTTRLR